MRMIIEVDEYKTKVAGYDPKKSEDFHIKSAQLADTDFTNELKSKNYTKVVLMSGGTASGKTEYATEYLKSKKVLVYDGTLKDFKGYEIKLQRVHRYDKNIKNIRVILIIPINIHKSLSAFFGRKRKMKLETFFETQIKSKLTVARILREEKTKVEIYFSDHKEGKTKLEYRRLNMKSGRKKAAAFLEDFAKVIKNMSDDIGLDIK